MVLIWGRKGYSENLGIIVIDCPSCNIARPFVVLQQGKKFTLYFIPTFSYDKKQVAICSVCHYAFEIPKNKKKELESILMSEEEFNRRLNQSMEQASRSEADAISTANPSRVGEIYKKCPLCAEKILYEAIVCRYCGRDLDEETT